MKTTTEEQLSAAAQRTLKWFSPTKAKSVNGNIAGNLDPYRELVVAGLLSEKALPSTGWFEYRLR